MLLLAALLLVALAGTAALIWRPWEPSGHIHLEGTNLYTCPMHPQVVQEGPGTCPICHMDLVPQQPAGASGSGSDSGGMNSSVVHLTDDGRITADVRTVRVGYRFLGSRVDAPANVDYNEGTQKVIAARYGGRIERLFARETGAYVRAGAPLMEIYSTELVAAQQEYLLAREARNAEALPIALSGDRDAVRRREERGERLIRAGRRKLEVYGMSAAQIEALEHDGEVSYSMTVFAPVSGVVVRMGVVEGAYVQEGTMLVELVDLSSVWVKANVSEADLPRVRSGLEMTVTGPGLGEQTLHGRVDLIYPTVDPASRTATVRALFSNPGYRLKPGMFLSASIVTESRESLVVPAGAVVRTGRRDLVYIEVEKNVFEAREIRLGRKDGEYYEVVDGPLRAGDAVVAEGGYLLDSEAVLTGTKPSETSHQGAQR